jgi:N-acetylmuramoyl-L-alanine amidase
MQLIRFFLVFAFLSCTNSFAQKSKVTVVIDAGHGGSDPGHLSANKNHLPEKDLNLLIAKKVGTYLTDLIQNVEVIYTRTDDSFVSLEDRVEIANAKNVDYFISIHCNANERHKIKGTESHVHTMSSKKSVALARSFEKEFSGKAGRNSRGVKDNDDREHSLQVLKFTKMTSVLVECGFLTNPTEANYLNTTDGQDILASAIYRGFKNFIIAEHPTIPFLKTSKKEESVASTGSFFVQITSSKNPIDTDHESFKKTGETIIREKLNTTSAYKYRYIIGSFDSKNSAKEVLDKVKKKGFPDAIIIQK